MTSGADLLTKLRAGFTVELRGSHDYVLPAAIEALKTLPIFPQTLTICTDDVFPDDLARVGGMIDVLRRLVRYGMVPLDALRAATLNAAMRIGRRADVLVLSDLTDMAVEHVFASGRHVAAGGRLTEPLRPDPVKAPTGTVKLSPLVPDDFRLRVAGVTNGSARLRTVVNPRFTEWGEITAPVRDGVVALPQGAIFMAMIHRHGLAEPTPTIGVLEGWSTWRGALATTVAHDSHNLIVFGRDPIDMAAAANAVIAAQGGMAVASGGTVRAVLPLPVCGLLSDAPMADVGESFRALRDAADAIADWKPPYLVFKAIVGASLACNPGPHVTDLGITDGTTGEVFASALIAAE